MPSTNVQLVQKARFSSMNGRWRRVTSVYFLPAFYLQPGLCAVNEPIT